MMESLGFIQFEGCGRLASMFIPWYLVFFFLPAAFAIEFSMPTNHSVISPPPTCGDWAGLVPPLSSAPAIVVQVRGNTCSKL